MTPWPVRGHPEHPQPEGLASESEQTVPRTQGPRGELSVLTGSRQANPWPLPRWPLQRESLRISHIDPGHLRQKTLPPGPALRSGEVLVTDMGDVSLRGTSIPGPGPPGLSPFPS